MNKKTASLALVVVLAAGALGVTTLRSSTVASSSSSSQATSPSAVAESAGGHGSAAVASDRDFHPGASFTYEVKTERVYADASGAALGKTSVSGRLSLTVVGSKDGGAAVRAVLEDASAKDLSAPFFFVLAEDGRVTRYGFEKAIPGDARRQLIAIVASLQLAPRSIERVEGDVSGEAVASYVKQGSSVLRTKSRYERVRTPAGLVSPGAIGGEYTVASKGAFTVDASGWPASLDERETVAAVFSAGRMTMTASTTARLAAKGDDGRFAGSFDAAEPGFDPDVEAIAEAAQLASRNADLGLVNGATFASLTSDLESSPDTRGRNRAVARMSALFRSNPESLRDARAKLLAKGTDERTKKAIAGALGSAPSAEAQHVLAETLRSAEVSTSVKMDAAMSLGQNKPISAEGKHALREASRSPEVDVASTATLALGSAARGGGDGAQDLVTDLLAKLEAASTPAEKALVLDALGNSGSPRALDAILAHVGHPSSTVRAAALGALKFQNDERATKALVNGMFDPDPGARRASLSAVGQQDVSAFIDALQLLFQKDADVEVRLLAVRVLARSLDAAAPAESVLAWVAQNDRDERVRTAATEALSRPKR